MEAFHYQALDTAGRSVSGVVQAETPRDARAQLRARGLLPSSLQEKNKPQAWTRGLSAAQLSLLTRQLSTLLDSGLTMEQALAALIEEAEAPATRILLTGVKAEVMAGASLAVALASYPRTFPEFYCALVHGGEDSGALPAVLAHLADYLDARQALRQKTSLALLYPVLVGVVAIAIVTGLLIYVVPQVVQVFQQSRQTLPLLTRALIALSDFLRSASPYLVVGMIAAGTGLRALLQRPGPRRRFDAWLLRTPALGPLIRGINTSRFASTLAILVGGGVPLLSALHSGARVVTNAVMREAIELAIEQVREGTSLARA